MYSGTTLTPLKRFDAWFGAHQKIDRIARRNLKNLLKTTSGKVPNGREIISFEGLDGPDGIKRKTPGQDELWHYYNPKNPGDDRIIKIIENQYRDLVAALKDGNRTRAAFEMSWLAHALVDGLTPAHHYPYEEELVKLRGGEGIETRTSYKAKLLMPGDSISKKVSNNWKMWGDKGLLATHFAFEWGIAVMINPLRLKHSMPSDDELAKASKTSIAELFRVRAVEVADLNMYETFYRSGWTPKLAKVARRELVPQIINLVTLAWYKASIDAGITEVK